jgi:prevent-host-death family protein
MLTGNNDRMQDIQATEAKAHLAELLRAVERGESFAITRYGRPVAHLVPAAVADRDARYNALKRFHAKRASWQHVEMSVQDILDARHEGHRA